MKKAFLLALALLISIQFPLSQARAQNQTSNPLAGMSGQVAAAIDPSTSVKDQQKILESVTKWVSSQSNDQKITMIDEIINGVDREMVSTYSTELSEQIIFGTIILFAGTGLGATLGEAGLSNRGMKIYTIGFIASEIALIAQKQHDKTLVIEHATRMRTALLNMKTALKSQGLAKGLNP